MHGFFNIKAVAALVVLVGCSSKKDSEKSLTPGFPEDFTWGAAMAGFQVDAGCPDESILDCEDPASDWYQWVTDSDLLADPSTHNSGDPLSLGPGHWELYPEDFTRAQGTLGLSSLRVSLEWSRLFPTDPGPVETVDELAEHADPQAVAAYHAYFAAMHAAGLRPMVTLNHYTLPLWIHDGKACHEDLDSCEARGWADPDRIVPAIGLYAGFCAREFGEEVDDWATLNEPFAVVLAGYLMPSEERTNPPGITNFPLAVEVLFTMAEAHLEMYDAVHANDATARVGAVPNLAAVQPEDPDNPEDVEGAEHFDSVYNRAFLEATVYGRFDRDLDGVAEDVRKRGGGMDFVGVNYYTRITTRGLTIPLVANHPWTDFYPSVLWEEYSEGIAEVAELAAGYDLPVIITENGTPDMDGAGERFLRPTLASLQGAIDEGVEIEGYYFWSLIDNYEWNHGMNLRFGLFSVDTETKERTLTGVGEAYASIVAHNGLEW